MGTKELKLKATKLREAATKAEAKVKEAKKKKSADAKKLEREWKKALKEAEDAEAKCAKAESEDEGKESEDEGESEEESEDEDGDDDAGHDDEDQDKALIKKMIKQYLGDDSDKMSKEERDECESLAKQAYQGHKEMGKKEDEAFHHAGEALKLASHLSKKQTEAEDEGDEDTPPPPPKKGKKPAPKDGADDDAGADDDDDGDASEAEDESESVESLRKTVSKLEKKLLESEGQKAALEAKTKKAEIDVYVDKKLKESGLAASVTKRFRETAGKFKSTADFDTKWKIFSEGAKGMAPTLDFSLLSEKGAASEGSDDGKDGKGLDFSECADND